MVHKHLREQTIHKADLMLRSKQKSARSTKSENKHKPTRVQSADVKKHYMSQTLVPQQQSGHQAKQDFLKEREHEK